MKANIKEIHEHFFGLDRHTLTMAGEEASIRLERGLRQSNNDNDNDNDDDNDNDNDDDNDNYNDDDNDNDNDDDNDNDNDDDNDRSPSVYFDPRRHRYVRIPRQQGQDGYGEAGET